MSKVLVNSSRINLQSYKSVKSPVSHAIFSLKISELRKNQLENATEMGDFIKISVCKFILQ